MPVNPAPNTRSHDPERIASLLIEVVPIFQTGR